MMVVLILKMVLKIFLGKDNLKNIDLERNNIKTSYAQVAINGSNEIELSEINKCIKSIINKNDWQFQGVVFKDNEGNRWRFRSDKYSATKSLRGNSNQIRDRFAQLYTQNLIHKYLEYYQEDVVSMTLLLMCINTIIKQLYDMYIDLRITKIKKTTDIDKMFLTHLYNIHGLYLTQLRPSGKKVTLNEVQLYIHKQPWQRISFLIKKIINANSI
jgi:hypothetical protein